LAEGTSLVDRLVLEDREAGKFQRLHLTASQNFRNVQVDSDHPPTRPVDEFQAALHYRSNQAGTRLALRLVLPQQTDPRTGRPLTTLLTGGRYTKADQWQVLSVGATESQISAQIQRLRIELHRTDIDTTGLYIDGCVLLAELNQGDAFLDIGPCSYGPILSVPDDVVIRLAGAGMRGSDAVSPAHRVTVERNRILVDDEPSFFRMIPEHGESAELLSRMGVTSVWVQDYRDSARIQELVDRGLVIVATPPFPQFDPADFGSPLQGLPPLEHVCPAASVFYLGTRVARKQLPFLSGCAREIRSADRKLRRPLMADIAAGEGVASREVDLVGMGPPVIGRTTTFGQARNELLRRQQASSQLTLPWMWIQAEPSGMMTAWRSELGYDAQVVEPEQILMQMVAAVSGGCRSVGFWKTHPLQSLDGESGETALAVELACLYLQILEPYLVKGRIERHISIETDATLQKSAELGQRGSGGLAAFNTSRLSGNPDLKKVPRQPDAAVIRSGHNSIVLAGFWDEASQFVPQPMYSRTGQLVVSASQTASAWKVTSTSVEGLPRKMTAGGLELDLEDFCQFAMVLVSADPQEARQLQQRVHRFAPRAAELQVELIRKKLQRIRDASLRLEAIGEPDTVVPSLFASVERILGVAQSELARSDYRSVESSCQQAGRLLRAIQNRYWQVAVRELPSPTASPHTTSFSSLTDHWQMMRQIRSYPASENLLASGSFENLRLIEDAGWRAPAPPEESGYQTSADVKSDRGRGAVYLRMIAWKPSAKPGISRPMSLLVLAPEIDARAGDVFEIRGQVRLGQSVKPEAEQPFLVFDDELGPEFAVRPKLEPSWRTFHMYRQVSQDGPLRMRFALDGAAEVHLDEVSIKKVGHREATSRIPSHGHTVRNAENHSRSGSRVQGAGYSKPSLP
jgi:hypothetical protein